MVTIELRLKSKYMIIKEMRNSANQEIIAYVHDTFRFTEAALDSEQ